MKTADMMVAYVRTHKNAFRLADQRVTKVNQSRYERRRVREYLRLGDWLAEA
jgi:aminoglycoside phosphotransferase family enzyme